MSEANVSRLEASFKAWNLLDSKFYQAWSAGTLPVSALKRYSREYGAFISLIGDGWAAHGDKEIAAEEREHAELWNRFAQSMGTKIDQPEHPAVQALVEKTKEFFSSAVTSLGALYAFECQQPATSKSKLEGLRAHYPAVSKSAQVYFEIHAEDEDEPRLLLSRIMALNEQDREKAIEACEVTCKLLREALDGLYEAECPMGCSVH